MNSKNSVKASLLKILFPFPSLNCPMSSCIRQLWVIDEKISPSLEERLEKRSRKDREIYISPRFLPFSPSSSNNSTLLLSESSGFQGRGEGELTRIRWLLFYSRSTADQLEAWSTETRFAVFEAGRDLKSFLTPVKTVFVAKSTWKLSNHFTENMMGQQRSISLNAWSRSTLDLASRISKFFFIRMNCFAGAPSLNSVPWYTYSNLDEKERKFDTDGRDCEKRRIEFFFLIWYNFSGKGVFIRNGIFRFNGNPFVFVLSILFLVMHLCDENINRKSS